MAKKITVVDLGYTHASGISDYQSLMDLYEAGSGHHSYLAEQVNLHVIRHLNQNKEIKIGEVNYHFFKGSNSRFWLPFRLHFFVNSLRPDIILLHSFLNPLQVLLLKLQTRAKIIIQYHGGGVPGGLKTLIQRVLKFRVNNYIFTASDQAVEFVKKGFILKRSHIYEVMEGSTLKKRIPKEEARTHLKIDRKEKMILWVGRLDENKDPMTILKGFDLLLKDHLDLKLYMIYNDDKLLSQLRMQIEKSSFLQTSVILIGQLAHEALDWYYSSADFFVLGSHHEGSGYALCEALACGCIPVVTDIPSFRMMTDNGRLGSLWKPGDKQSFVIALNKALEKNLEEQAMASVAFFEKRLSFSAISKEQNEIFQRVLKNSKNASN